MVRRWQVAPLGHRKTTLRRGHLAVATMGSHLAEQPWDGGARAALGGGTPSSQAALSPTLAGGEVAISGHDPHLRRGQPTCQPHANGSRHAPTATDTAVANTTTTTVAAT